jgi:alcohol dehydrogenase class IV
MEPAENIHPMDGNLHEKIKSFNYTLPAQEILFGAGVLAQLGSAVGRFGWQRLMLCTSPSLRPSGYVAPVEAALGERLVASYERTQAHVLDYQLTEALESAIAHNVDAVIGLGGGSAIGIAKAVSATLEEKLTGKPPRSVHPTEQPLIPVTAIPTTYAGSEMTPVYGVTHTTGDTARKVTVKDIKIAPKLVLYDPTLTLSLPPNVTTGTGINALAHCIEALYSTTRHPLATAAALESIGHITRALPLCYAKGADLAARTEMLIGAHLAGAALATVTMAIHHGVCHILGGTVRVPHGIANAIVLPHAMRFNLDVAAPELARAAEAMGLVRENKTDAQMAQAGIEYVEKMIRGLSLPQRLRDAGVSENDLPKLAALAFNSATVQNNPRRLASVQEAETLFRAAW